VAPARVTVAVGINLTKIRKSPFHESLPTLTTEFSTNLSDKSTHLS